MKNTIKELNELRDFFSAKQDYLTALKIGKIIGVLIDEQYNLESKYINEKLELVKKL